MLGYLTEKLHLQGTWESSLSIIILEYFSILVANWLVEVCFNRYSNGRIKINIAVDGDDQG